MVVTTGKHQKLEQLLANKAEIDDTQNIDEFKKQSPYAQIFNNVQGNILKDHGRDYARHIFLNFTAKPSEVKRWIANFARAKNGTNITSVLQQMKDAASYKASGKKLKDVRFTNFFLSAAGYRALQYTEDELKPFGRTFLDGMHGARGRLNDPDVRPDPENQWIGDRDPRDIHAMILIANDDDDALFQHEQEVLNSIEGVATKLRTARGNVRYEGATTRRTARGYVIYENGDNTKPPIEHFGYFDGISNPLFLKSDLIKANERAGPHARLNRWNPLAPLNLVLLPDPLGVDVESDVGSFLVFRKLEQDVRAFSEQKENLARKILKMKEYDQYRIDLAGAFAFGRFPAGTPVILNDVYDGFGNDILNDFDYREDPIGAKCPLHAHIRKANPRDPLDLKERAHRIVRRGITYNEHGQVTPTVTRGMDTSSLPQSGLGLLFMCYQSGIELQFEYIQKRLNNPKPDAGTAGLDPIVGQLRSGESPQEIWPNQWGQPEPPAASCDDFRDFVELKGGEYFFAPSIGFLENIQ